MFLSLNVLLTATCVWLIIATDRQMSTWYSRTCAVTVEGCGELSWREWDTVVWFSEAASGPLCGAEEDPGSKTLCAAKWCETPLVHESLIIKINYICQLCKLCNYL